MRKISEMYKESGGTIWKHVCSECRFFKNNGKKHLRCTMYPGESEWKEDYIACKYFSDRSQIGEDQQITIFDLI